MCSNFILKLVGHGFEHGLDLIKWFGAVLLIIFESLDWWGSKIFDEGIGVCS